MRAEAITRIEHVIGGSLRPVLTGAHRAALISQGARGQRLVTPRGQVIYLRTRSYSAERPPFFTVQPRTFDDANWYIFVCGGRGHIVAPAAELHQLAPGLHRDAGGDFKPTFLIDHERCALYAFGATRDVSRWRDAYDAIGTDERRSPPKSDRGLVLPPVGVDPTYTDPVARLAVDCGTCGTAVIGYERGSADFRALMKAIKAHEDEYHPPYERDLLIPSLQHAVDRFNGGELVPQVVGRYRIQMFRAPGRSTTRDAD
jgi:hypothetical protein